MFHHNVDYYLIIILLLSLNIIHHIHIALLFRSSDYLVITMDGDTFIKQFGLVHVGLDSDAFTKQFGLVFFITDSGEQLWCPYYLKLVIICTRN